MQTKSAFTVAEFGLEESFDMTDQAPLSDAELRMALASIGTSLTGTLDAVRESLTAQLYAVTEDSHASYEHLELAVRRADQAGMALKALAILLGQRMDNADAG